MKKQWTISSDGIEHIIEYQGSKLSGNIKMLIDGVYCEYVPTVVKKVGMLAKLDVADENVILHVSLNGKDVNLAVDGVYVDSQMPVAEQVNLETLSSRANSSTVLQNKIKTGFGSFFTFVILTYLNLLLLIIDVGINFPFSATVPQIPLVLGKAFYDEGGMLSLYAFGAAVSFILASVYLLLYFLSKKRIAPMYITIVLMIIDTIVLLLLSLDDITVSLIDLVFHIWVIWSMINLLKSKLVLRRAMKDEFLESSGLNTK